MEIETKQISPGIRAITITPGTNRAASPEAHEHADRAEALATAAHFHAGRAQYAAEEEDQLHKDDESDDPRALENQRIAAANRAWQEAAEAADAAEQASKAARRADAVDSDTGAIRANIAAAAANRRGAEACRDAYEANQGPGHYEERADQLSKQLQRCREAEAKHEARRAELEAQT